MRDGPVCKQRATVPDSAVSERTLDRSGTPAEGTTTRISGEYRSRPQRIAASVGATATTSWPKNLKGSATWDRSGESVASTP